MGAAAAPLEPELGCPSGLAPASDPNAPAADPAAFVRRDAKGRDTLELLVQGAKCANCIKKIEGALAAMPGMQEARLNLSTGRLTAAWTKDAIAARDVTATLETIGYHAIAFDPEAQKRQIDHEGRSLLIALAVAGFASMNIMMFTIPIWTGDGEMGAATRTMLHWWSAIIALPAALFSGQTFFRSAWSALSRGRANMDVPISLAVLLTLSMSLYETATHGERTYFDGVCMLLFLLLIGRYLDHKLRETARSAAADLLAMQTVTAARIGVDGKFQAVSAKTLQPGDRIALMAGDRAPADGVIEEGLTDLDLSMLTGETLPKRASIGDPLPAGAVNLTGRLVVRVTARAAESTVAQLARLMEIGEQGRANFVRIADKAARLYVPVVHTLAALTFIGWFVVSQDWHHALLTAVAVLIITCPCALGLAVPAVQVVATGALFKRGVLVKTGDALERLAQINAVVFDKTGTLTRGRPLLRGPVDADALQRAALLARASHHPLARALVEAAGAGPVARDAKEHPGDGVSAEIDGVTMRLGRRGFVAPNAAVQDDEAMEMWFAAGDGAPLRFAFADGLRDDAAAVIANLKARGIKVSLLSGDRARVARETACEAGIEDWRADVRPDEKARIVQEMQAKGLKVLMVGDGLNDAGALSVAHASASPGTALDISQQAADIVFQGALLKPLITALDVSRGAQKRVWENLMFSAAYNVVAVPIAVFGFVTPLIAALAMSGSSLVVTLNALRLRASR